VHEDVAEIEEADPAVGEDEKIKHAEEEGENAEAGLP
jgi:hypothetical protein